MFNIAKASEAHITSNGVDALASATGESPGKTRQAMSTGILGIIASVMQRGENPAGAAGILSVLKLPLFGGAEKLSAAFLGDRGQHVTGVIAKANGIGQPAAHGVMVAALPLVASALGTEVSQRKLDASGLVDLLRSQKKLLLDHPGLGSLAGALGLHRDEPAVPKVEPKMEPPITTAPKVTAPIAPKKVVDVEHAHDVKRAVEPIERRPPARAPVAAQPIRAAMPERPRTPAVERPLAPVVEHTTRAREPVVTHIHTERKRSWWPVALGLGALGLGAILFGRRAAETDEATPVAEAPAVPEPVPAAPMTEPAPAVPTSETTITSAEVVEETDPLAKQFAGKDVPEKVTLSDVTFDFGTTKLATGEQTVDHMADMMKAHPTSQVRIEGHTDSIGKAATNNELSLKRATVIRKALMDKGIDGKRIMAVGVGEAAPVAPNDTDEGRAKNRRIDAVIIKR